MRTRLSSPCGDRRRFWLRVLLLAIATGGPTAVASAQTPFVPYFGKNNIHYDRFNWQIYTTDHFEIYYYPELEQHLERRQRESALGAESLVEPADDRRGGLVEPTPEDTLLA